MAINYNTKIVTTTPYNIVPSDEVIFVNVSGPSSIILPIVSGGDKKAFYIKDYSGNSKINPITITARNGKTIDGVPFSILNNGYSHVLIIYDGVNWKTIA
jgi:hypothetical protein